MALALSILLVFGSFALLVAAAGADDPGASLVPVSWLIHARVPYALFAVLGTGVALGVASALRRPRRLVYSIVTLEVLAAGLLVYYFAGMSFLPPHSLSVAVGDPFPSYSLLDQDRTPRVYEAATVEGSGTPVRKRALYIFYRGDW